MIADVGLCSHWRRLDRCFASWHPFGLFSNQERHRGRGRGLGVAVVTLKEESWRRLLGRKFGRDDVRIDCQHLDVLCEISRILLYTKEWVRVANLWLRLRLLFL